MSRVVPGEGLRRQNGSIADGQSSLLRPPPSPGSDPRLSKHSSDADRLRQETSQSDRMFSLENPTIQSVWQVCSSLKLINWHLVSK